MIGECELHTLLCLRVRGTGFVGILAGLRVKTQGPWEDRSDFLL